MPAGDRVDDQGREVKPEDGVPAGPGQGQGQGQGQGIDRQDQPRVVPQAVPVQPQPAAPVQGLDPALVMQQLVTMQGQTLRMLDIMHRQLEIGGRAATPVPVQAPRVDYLELASRHHPPTFGGSTDPVVMDNWTYQIEQVFEYIDCLPDRQVQVAARYLTEGALTWWRTRQAELLADLTFGWEQFTHAMRIHFFSPETLNAKKREFLSLRQGQDKTAKEY